MPDTTTTVELPSWVGKRGSLWLNPRCDHSTDTIVGYVVRVAVLADDERAADLAWVDGGNRYAEALEIRRAAEWTPGSDGPGAYTVDNVYACGCRS